MINSCISFHLLPNKHLSLTAIGFRRLIGTWSILSEFFLQTSIEANINLGVIFFFSFFILGLEYPNPFGTGVITDEEAIEWTAVKESVPSIDLLND